MTKFQFLIGTLVLVCISTIDRGPARGQDAGVLLQIGFRETDGEPRFSKTELPDAVPTVDIRLPLLANEETQRELEMTPPQSAKVSQLVSMNKSAKAGFADGRNSLTEADEGQAKILDEYVQSLEKTKQEISELLLPHQSVRLEQLMLRIPLERKGIEAFAKKVAEIRKVSITDQEIVVIRNLMHDSEQRLHNEIRDEYSKFIEQLKAKLPGQEQFLSDYWARATFVTLDILFIDVEHIDKLVPTNIEDELRRRLGTLRFLNLDAVGNWESRVYDQLGAFRVLSTSLLSSQEHDFGGAISAEQIARIKELNTERNWKSKELQDEYRERMANGEDADVVRKSRTESEAKLDEKYLGFVFNDVLFDAQRVWLLEFLRQREINSLGVLGMLYLEKNPEGTKITDADRKEMRGLLKSEIAALKKVVVQTYQESINNQVARLPDSIKRDVEQLLGEKPEFMLPNLTLLFDRVEIKPDSDSAPADR